MGVKLMLSLLSLLLISVKPSNTKNENPCERICGKWETVENNLIIQVYMQDNNFKAKIVWFKDTGGLKMDCCKDIHNPNPDLQNRRILGMNVLSDLKYHSGTRSWEDGMIYDAQHGRDWNAAVYLDETGLMKVKGFWHFKFIGKTLTFKRV